jgi:hypothetical protein
MMKVAYLGFSILFWSNGLRADTSDYFPLEVGNSWLYHLTDSGLADGDRYRSISVDGTESVGDLRYFDVSYFGRTVLLRADTNGSIVMLDRQSGTEQPWLAFSQPEGATFDTTIDRCSSSGRIVSRDAGITVPAGEFTGSVQMTFAGNCADAGITQQFYAPEVGLLSHEETSIAGPRRWDLVYYRAGVRNASRPELSFTMALDAARYDPGSTAGVRLTLRSTNPEPLLLQFPSSQTYDLKIYDSSGKTVYTWSASRAFAQIFREEKFGPGERTYGLTALLGDLAPGRYRAQGYLTTNRLMFTAEAAFEIAEE